MSFDAIRCYNNEELKPVLSRLMEEKQFLKVLSTVYALLPKDEIIKIIQSVSSVTDFQRKLVIPFLQMLEDNLTRGIDFTGLEKLQDGKNYLYISNHRDIILDSAFLCLKLTQKSQDTVEIAIGDNLLIHPWIEDLVRVNKSFIVRRGLSAKQILESSRLLAEYIHHAIHEKKQSVWLAQREGRAKDSNDRTQDSLLKMLNMSGKASVTENLSDLNICPMAISYEFDPCDFLKAKEFQLKRDYPEYKKQPSDDLLNMKTGVMGYKGKVVYSLAGDISEKIRQIEREGLHKNELFSQIAELIDREIFDNYVIFPGNKIAYDLLNGTDKFSKEYTLMEKLDFEKYLEKQIEKIDLEYKDIDFLMVKLLEMYANPLINALDLNA